MFIIAAIAGSAEFLEYENFHARGEHPMLMKSLICLVCYSLFMLVAFPGNALPKSSTLANRIEGQVYDPNHRPVENLYVELLNEVDSVIQRTKTSASGRFSFVGVPPGRLTVRVVTFGTNFMEQTQEVIITRTRNNSDTDYIDFNLRFYKRSSRPEVDIVSGVIFAQEVPPAARTSYLKGVADFEKDQEKGLAEIEEALKTFPNYFEALNWVGKELISTRQYEKGCGSVRSARGRCQASRQAAKYMRSTLTSGMVIRLYRREDRNRKIDERLSKVP